MGILPKIKAHEHQALLNEAEKQTLVHWIKYLGLIGLPVCKRTLRPKIHAILRSKGIAVTEKTVSKSWIRNFRLQFADEIKAARGAGLDPKRAQAFNFTSVNNYFDLLDRTMKENDIPWENVYNMDEKGIQIGGGRKGTQEKYFFFKGDRMMYRQQSDNLELVTIVDCVCADGTAEIRPAFVFKGKTKFGEWMEVDDDIL